jgi:ribosomal protein S28E/S33
MPPLMMVMVSVVHRTGSLGIAAQLKMTVMMMMMVVVVVVVMVLCHTWF